MKVALGIRDKPIAPGLTLAERLCRTVDRIDPAECLDYIIVLGEAHLRRILKSYARYYNETRTHGLGEGYAPIAHRKEGRAYSLPPSPRELTD
jgi:hypothetical protein